MHVFFNFYLTEGVWIVFRGMSYQTQRNNCDLSKVSKKDQLGWIFDLSKLVNIYNIWTAQSQQND